MVNFSTKKFLLSAIIIVGILFLIYFFIFRGNVQPTPTPTASPSSTPSVILKQAPLGQLVEGFLPGLIVDKSADIIGSAENISNNPNTRFLVSSFETAEDISKIRSQYLSYFKQNNWVVANDRQSNGQLSLSAFSTAIGSVNINTFKKQGSTANIVMITFNKLK